MGTWQEFILLVEDDIDISEAITSILTEEKFHVVSTSNGVEAMEYLKNAKQLPALILLDIMMPKMNGLEFRKLQLDQPRLADIPTIILSAAGINEEIDNLHFDSNIKKPLDIETLLDEVKKFY